MRSKVICKKCKKPNELNRIFCWHCGEKLDYSRIRRRKTFGSESVASMAFRFIKVAILALLVGVLALVLWPVEPGGARGSKDDAELASRKIRALDAAMEISKAVDIVFEEGEVNAYMDHIVEKPGGTALKVGVREVNVTFTPTYITALIITEMGPLHWTYEFKGVPSTDDAGPALELSALRLGHLPVPKFGWTFIAGRVGEIFGGMEREHRVLNSVNSFEMKNGSISLSTK